MARKPFGSSICIPPLLLQYLSSCQLAGILSCLGRGLPHSAASLRPLLPDVVFLADDDVHALLVGEFGGFPGKL